VLHRDYPDQVCSIAWSLEVVGERWTLLILRDAVAGIERFEEFQESLGIASNVLSHRLELLCDEQVLERIPDPERPGRPKYILTDKGRELAPALLVLMK
jgi:DNA-binding HxlR family transcriptional regulator